MRDADARPAGHRYRAAPRLGLRCQMNRVLRLCDSPGAGSATPAERDMCCHRTACSGVARGISAAAWPRPCCRGGQLANAGAGESHGPSTPIGHTEPWPTCRATSAAHCACQMLDSRHMAVLQQWISKLLTRFGSIRSGAVNSSGSRTSVSAQSGV